MGYQTANVEPPRPAFETVEIFRECLPCPVDALSQGSSGDVLDTFHQLDQPVLAAGLDRSESDTAVACDHRGDSMAGRRFEDGIPGDLPVVVRVHVDETGNHDAARSVDLPVGFAL